MNHAGISHHIFIIRSNNVYCFAIFSRVIPGFRSPFAEGLLIIIGIDWLTTKGAFLNNATILIYQTFQMRNEKERKLAGSFGNQTLNDQKWFKRFKALHLLVNICYTIVMLLCTY